MITIQRESINRGRVNRTISRSRRRARLRVTALPMRREVINPTRMPDSEVLSTLNTMNLPAHELPEFLTSKNSEALARRADFGKQKTPRFGLESTRLRAANHDLPAGKRNSRLRCDGRNGFQRPSEEGACDHADDDGQGFLFRLWSSCGRGIRTAFSACVLMVDRCVS